MQTIASVQVLRAIAALGVVATHYGLFVSQSLGNPLAITTLAFGEAGVDLFFVISGFIMVYASQPLYGRADAPMTFFARRVIRIVPLYWLVTTTYLAAALLFPGSPKDLPLDYVASSYAFIPYPAPDGSTLQPLVGQGWSLNYEMPFYAIFALTLFAPARVAILGASGLLAGVVALGQVFDPANPALRFWTDPIILEFVFGMLIGLLYREGLRLPRALGWALFAGGIALFLASAQTHALLGGRLIPWGIPAIAAVAGATLGAVAASGAIWRGLVLVGEASYALYLTHAVVVRGLVSLFHRAEINLPFWPGLALALLLSVALAIGVYYAFERPVTRALRSLVATRRAKRKSIEAKLA